MRILENITYVERPSEKLALDLYLPRASARAVVLFVHGGGFSKGSRKSAEAMLLARRLTREGYAIASISYRLNTPLEAFELAHRKSIRANRKRSVEAGLTTAKRLMGPAFEAAREDLCAAIGFVKDNAAGWGVASDKVMALGISAGGIAALSAAYGPNTLDAYQRPDATIALGSAIIHPWLLSAEGPPALMIHSHRDRIIAPSNARLAQDAARQANAPLRVMFCARRGHAAPFEALLSDKDSVGTPYWTHMQLMLQSVLAQSSARKRLIRLDVSQRPPPSF